MATLAPKTIADVTGVTTEKKNRKLYDVVAKEVFFSNGCLFVEGQEDAHIVGQYVDENNGPPIEIFGYGSGGATHIDKWLAVAFDLGLKAAALFDGDEAGEKAFRRCKEAFAGQSRVFLKILPTEDIRDKPDQKVEGIFDERWVLKQEFRAFWTQLLDDFSRFLNSNEPPNGSPADRNNWWRQSAK